MRVVELVTEQGRSIGALAVKPFDRSEHAAQFRRAAGGEIDAENPRIVPAKNQFVALFVLLLVLGMQFVFEQPNLDNAAESHLYFDPGDGRLITVFTNEKRVPDPRRTPTDPGCVHHLAFALSQATFAQTVERLDERRIKHSGVKDRGFMDSIYFTDPLGLLIELASYRFEPPAGHTHADVLFTAHRLRVARGDYNIAPVHLADAIEQLVSESRESLSRTT